MAIGGRCRGLIAWWAEAGNAAQRAPAAGILLAVGLLGLMPAPAQAAPEYQLPSACGYCHDTLYEQFRPSMHAQAAIDPVYLYEVGLAHEDTDGAVGPFCLKCHAPIGHMLGETQPPLGAGDGSALSELGASGVACDFCHTVSGVEAGRLGNASFQAEPGIVKRGPFDDSVSPGHETAMSELHLSAEFCGMCHDVYHPANGLPLESTYTEWKSSDYAKEGVTCQDCHMTPGPGPETPPSGQAAVYGPERPAVMQMTFTGANAVFGDAVTAEANLKAAATLELAVEAPAEVAVGSPVKALVTVTNVGAGHSLPTGLTDVRQMWLEVSAVSADGGAVPVGEVRFGTIFADENGGHDHVPVWRAVSVYSDHRVPAKGALVEEVAFEWPAGVGSDASIVAELKYSSFTQELADKAGAGVTVPVIVMASAEQAVAVAGSGLPLALVGWVAVGVVAVAAAAVGVVLLVRRRRAA